jgi:ketosteroid isomerase-like protein
MRLLPPVLLVAAAAGCAGRGARTAAVPEPSLTPARDSLIAADLARSDSVRRLGFVEGFTRCLASDIVFLHAGVRAVYGREAARAVLESSQLSPGTLVRWEPLGGGISHDGRAGYTYGVTAVASTDAAGRIEHQLRMERYIAFWTRTPGEPWRIAAYAEVEAPPPPPGTTSLAIGAAWSSPPGQPVRGKLAEVLDQLRRTDTEFSAAASREGIAAAFAGWAAPTGVLFVGPEIVIGPAAIRELYARIAIGRSLAWNPVHAGAAASGDLGFTVGEYVSTGRGSSGAVSQRFGKYLTVWRRQADGQWRYVVDGGNPSPAPDESRASRGSASPDR